MLNKVPLSEDEEDVSYDHGDIKERWEMFFLINPWYDPQAVY